MADQNPNQTPKMLFVGAYEPTQEQLDYAKACVSRAKEAGYRILVGDNPKGFDQAIVNYAQEAGFGEDEVLIVHPFKKVRIETSGFKRIHYQVPYQQSAILVFKQCEIFMAALADVSMAIGRSPSAWNVHHHMGLLGKTRHSSAYHDRTTATGRRVKT